MQVNLHITLRVFWSIFWRSALIGGLIGGAFDKILPPSPIETQVMEHAVAEMDKKFEVPANPDGTKDTVKDLEHTMKVIDEFSYVDAFVISLRHAQTAIRERGLLSTAYLYDVIKTVLPTVIAMFIAISIVLEKRYKRFSLRVSDNAGTTRPTLWWPSLAFITVMYAPLFLVSGAFYYVAWFTSSLEAFIAYNLAGVVLFFALVHFALRYPYKKFRLHIEPASIPAVETAA